MKKLLLDYTTRLEFSAPVVDHHFLLRCQPWENHQQQITSLEFEIEPSANYRMETDSFYNPVVVGCLTTPHDTLTWHVRAIAFVDRSRTKPEVYKPLYRYPSVLTHPGPVIDALVDEARVLLRGNSKVQSPLEIATFLMNMLFERFSYVPGVTNVRTTAEEALAGGQGVCQDYAQILIACCRRLGVMAKYVAGMLMGEGATHAWVEIYQAGRWWPIDPTHNRPVDDGYVKIANGRDYTDCMLDIGVFRGDVTQRQTVTAILKEQ